MVGRGRGWAGGMAGSRSVAAWLWSSVWPFSSLAELMGALRRSTSDECVALSRADEVEEREKCERGTRRVLLVLLWLVFNLRPRYTRLLAHSARSP